MSGGTTLGWDLSDSGGAVGWGGGGGERPASQPFSPQQMAMDQPGHQRPDNYYPHGFSYKPAADNPAQRGAQGVNGFSNNYYPHGYNYQHNSWSPGTDAQARRDRWDNTVNEARERIDPTLRAMSEVDANSLFKQWFDGMKSYNSVGLESQRQQAKALADLDYQSKLGQTRLAGNLNGIEESRLFNMLNMDNQQYDANVGDIGAMKKYLLESLGYRNDLRDTQSTYYGTKGDEARAALESALAGSDEERASGERILGENFESILSAFAGRGSARSRGHELARSTEQGKYDDLLTSIARRDTNTRLDYKSTMSDIRHALDKIKHERKMDSHSYKEETRGLDKRLGDLGIEKERGGYNFMANVAKVRAQKADAERQAGLAAMYRQQAINTANAQFAAATQKAQQDAYMVAAQKSQEWNMGLNTSFGGKGKEFYDEGLHDAYATGNMDLFNLYKWFGTLGGHY